MALGSSAVVKGLQPGSLELLGAVKDVRKIEPLWAEWRRRHRFRADLRRLLKIGPHMVEDIGFTYEEALQESRKPLWQA